MGQTFNPKYSNELTSKLLSIKAVFSNANLKDIALPLKLPILSLRSFFYGLLDTAGTDPLCHQCLLCNNRAKVPVNKTTAKLPRFELIIGFLNDFVF
jgi:hypothetical protein